MDLSKSKKVYFIDESLQRLFENLSGGDFSEKELYNLINCAMDDLQENPMRYIKIQRDRWPKEYIQKYKINNLWKYNLPNGWRIMYTIRVKEVEIVSLLLEWFSHKEYERKFGY